ncbi:adenylyl-sulfate kinase 3-like isoform X3 [Momordica charantia]|uniref:Adenylyl-sulfate kinase n=1 Tax=Momordica charantia TaxID=3673 RepID=A0A6J1DTA0_MOMCH|nr:adenylyl-sulfate kinase 3-like isoform X3 [Momordica charantia]
MGWDVMGDGMLLHARSKGIGFGKPTILSKFSAQQPLNATPVQIHPLFLSLFPQILPLLPHSIYRSLITSPLLGKSTVACSLSRELHGRGKVSYVLDGDNLRYGLNKDLGFKAEDRVENIRRVGEVAKLFADSGLICIASLISPYRKDRDSCRALLPEACFIEVFMNMPLELCEARDAKGLYKLAREGKIRGFTGIDDPYEPPLNCEIELRQNDGVCPTPCAMAKQIVAYLEEKGFLQAQ